MTLFRRSTIYRWCFLFLRLLLSKSNKSIVLTCAGKRDGGGAQLHACFSVMVFAHDFGFRYVHTPFSFVEHKPIDYDTQSWLDGWNSYIYSIPPMLDPSSGLIGSRQWTTFSLRAVLLKAFLPPRLPQTIAIPHAHRYTDLFPSRYSHVSSNYRRHKLNESHKSCQIVVHLRRGDVRETGPYSDRYTQSGYVLSCILNLLRALGDRDLTLCIFSTSWCPILADPGRYSTNVNLDYSTEASVFDVIQSMALSDYLLMAKSSLSYVGALLSTGVVFYQEFWHPALPHWKRLSSLSSYDDYSQA